MSLPRFAGWGAVGGLLLTIYFAFTWLPLLSLQGERTAGLLALLGAGSAAGSLALARRADDQELLESGEEVAEIRLTEEEKHQLLGEMQPG